MSLSSDISQTADDADGASFYQYCSVDGSQLSQLDTFVFN